jgi:hypothetical protein
LRPGEVLVEEETGEEGLSFGLVGETVEALDCDIVGEGSDVVAEVSHCP